jgi:membrane protease YdiL (CAAX protease family)
VLAVASGFAEEAVFRGSLFTLADPLAGGIVAVAATSLAFGAAHGLFLPGFRAWSLFALAAGVVLGVLRVHTGGVLASAIAHATVNLVNLPVVMRVGKDFPPPDEAISG